MIASAISGELRALIRGGNADESLRRACVLLARAEADNDDAAVVSYLGAVSMAHQYAGRPRESLLVLYRALDLLTVTVDDRATAAWMCSLAAVDLAGLGDVVEALKMLNRAQSFLATGECDPTTGVRIWNNIAVAHYKFGQHRTAVEAIDQAIGLARDVADPYLGIHSRANRVIYGFLLAREQLETDPAAGEELAAQTLAEAEALEVEARTKDWPHVVAMMYREAGPVLVQMGQPGRATRVLGDCLEVAAAVGRQREMAAMTIRLATVARLQGRVDDAGAQLRSIQALIPAEDTELRIEFYAEQTEIEAAKGNHAAALASFRTFHRLSMKRVSDHSDAKAQALAARLGAEQDRLRAELQEARATELQRSVDTLTSQAALLTMQARHDPLTGVGNRRYFDEQVPSLQQGADRAGISVMFLDLDHFKQVNDVYGHAIGDRVLIQVASLLNQDCRPQDRLCRFGGEEFLILLPGLTGDRASAVAERLRRTIEDYDWDLIYRGLTVTCSLGVASGVGRSIADLLFDADAAVYRAKAAGRNRVATGNGGRPVHPGARLPSADGDVIGLAGA